LRQLGREFGDAADVAKVSFRDIGCVEHPDAPCGSLRRTKLVSADTTEQEMTSSAVMTVSAAAVAAARSTARPSTDLRRIVVTRLPSDLTQVCGGF
jgi:hypothetical protein